MKTEVRNGTVYFGSEKSMEEQLKASGVEQGHLDALFKAAGNDHKTYKAYMSIMLLGHACIDQKVPADGDHGADETSDCVINSKFYNQFVNSKHGTLKSLKIRELMKQTTPAGKKGELNDISGLGLFVRSLNELSSTTPFESTQYMTNSEMENLLRGQHNKYIDSIIDVGNAIKTRAWIEAIPEIKAGSFSQIMHGVVGMVQSFQQALQDIYKGIKDAVIIAKLWVNQQIMKLQKFIVSKFIKENLQIILTLFCFIFSVIQTLLDDLAFFGQLFNASDSFFKMFNILQTVVNWGSQIISYAYNPITGLLPALFPKEVGTFFDYLNKLDKIPQMFTNFLSRHTTFNKQFNSTAIATLNTIVKRYGLGSKLGALEPVVDAFGTVNLNNSKWQRSTAPVFNTPIELKPLYFPNPRQNWSGTLTGELMADGSSVIHNLQQDFNSFRASGQQLFEGIQKSSSELFATAKSVFVSPKKDNATNQAKTKDDK